MTNWTQAEHPVAPWDTPGLPPRRMAERCPAHPCDTRPPYPGGCAYRDDDPNRCPSCHRTLTVDEQKTTPRCHPSTPTAKTALVDHPGVKTRPSEWGACARCGDRWTGRTICHCPTCCRTFSSASAFDAHRRGGRCRNPSDAGLVPVDKQHWSGWGWPEMSAAVIAQRRDPSR